MYLNSEKLMIVEGSGRLVYLSYRHADLEHTAFNEMSPPQPFKCLGCYTIPYFIVIVREPDLGALLSLVTLDGHAWSWLGLFKPPFTEHGCGSLDGY